MSTAVMLIKRNIKLFFKDKGMFLTSLITPAILLVLYVTFLGKVYHDSFTSNLPEFIQLSDSLIDGLVGGQLISSILAVSCVTVAFCSNFLMVQDKANGTIKDLKISPVSSSALSMSYYIASLASTLIICFAATGICLAYAAFVGWYMSAQSEQSSARDTDLFAGRICLSPHSARDCRKSSPSFRGHTARRLSATTPCKALFPR